jgi:hypothetical protein
MNVETIGDDACDTGYASYGENNHGWDPHFLRYSNNGPLGGMNAIVGSYFYEVR